ncbi:[Fe-Fe] hydrogenase large subunit C-terminal domain-containing protein [Rhodovulum sp.]|uniref:[Fe-Fe] hydrogenase large subunit C-terminal domain-containing protein n=1 Tax=Rhodovulum sp. TaxID=34009 RepID=UPI0017C7B737|nr:[Fe-Fe] hydrogenase large subunit C-terminal domain-containing protein [Rhodovulum sp.]HDR28595.1 2Fe-2S iron-sulfur cluster binding domain-containing protein [Rhodovulum sp.]
MCTSGPDTPGPDAPETVALILNGTPCTSRANEIILSCVRRHDIYIPTLCEPDDIDHTPGTCRVCLVEIVQAGHDAPQIVTACNTPIRDAMEVRTRSKRARDMQRLQVELLMADHLQDCATCIRHGDCELQDLAQFVGLTENRFFDRARTEARPIDLTSPAMVRDMRRCVRCQRCVAICRHHQQVDALAMEGTGLDRLVALRGAEDYLSSACVSGGQCVLVCPTDALGERDQTDRAIDCICDPDLVTVVQFAPAVRVAFGEEFGMPPGTSVEGHIATAWRKLGFDVVLTTREFARLLRREGIDLKTLESSGFDSPFLREYSGAGAVFGTTGGVMEAALCTVYAIVNGRELKQIELTQLRGFEGIREARVDLGGQVGEVRVAMVHGLGDTPALVEAVLAGKADYDFIEVMACPGGCVDGGGSPRLKKAYLPLAQKRRETIYAVDRAARVRRSHNNPQVQALYRDFLGAPNSELAQQLLHTSYEDRRRELKHTVKEIWDDITMSTMVY